MNRLQGRWVDSCVFNSDTYILCSNNEQQTFIVYFDGTYALPVTDIPWNFVGQSIVAYGGRLYVGGFGTDVNGGEKYAELYEITGASVRLVRSWEEDSYQSVTAYPKAIHSLLPFSGLLWWSEKGKRMWTYDATSDGFFGASEIQNGAGATDVEMKKLTYGRQRLIGWGDSATAGARGLYRIATADDTPAAYKSELVTSDFAVEPALHKRWSEIVMLSRYGAVDKLEYSLDAGAAWTELVRVVTPTGNLNYTRADLTQIPQSGAIRFRMTFDKAQITTGYTELLAYTVSFMFVNTQHGSKHVWNFVVNAAHKVEGRNGTTVTQNVDLMCKAFWYWRKVNAVIKMRDLDGDVRHVQCRDMVEQQPIIGPNIVNRPEAFLSLTVVEV
jgi:hypothetical protein